MFTTDVTRSDVGTTKNPRPENFGYIQEFWITQGFNISILETHVGVLTFSKVTHIQTEPTPNRSNFENAVQNSRNHCFRERAKANLALITTDKIFARSSRDVSSSKIVVLITDRLNLLWKRKNRQWLQRISPTIERCWNNYYYNWYPFKIR